MDSYLESMLNSKRRNVKDGSFKALLGIDSEFAEIIYHKYLKNIITIQEFFFFLNFCKVYSCGAVHAAIWGVCRQTFERNIFKTAEKIANTLPEVNFNDRLEKEIPGFSNCFCIVDVIEVEIQRPAPNLQASFYSGKKKHHTIKYEVAVKYDGKPVWVTGPQQGFMHDLDMARNNGILNQVEDSEQVMGDTAYIEPLNSFLTPFKGPGLTPEQETWNKRLGGVRVVAENFFGRLQKFSIFKTPYRHHIDKHKYVFMSLLKIINIELDYFPLRNFV